MSFQVSKSAARKPHLSAQAPTTGRIAELTRAVIPLDDKAGYVAEIAKLWAEAQDRFLTIGRYLVIARRTLKHGEFEAMIARELPFAKATAHQLRTVAEAVDEGRFREEELPRSYATVYYLTTLSPGQLELARKRGLISPETTRPAVIAFKRSLKEGLTGITGELPPNAAGLRRQKILAEITRRQREIASLEAELAELDRSGAIIDGQAVEIRDEPTEAEG
jgi:transposase-like protein